MANGTIAAPEVGTFGAAAVESISDRRAEPQWLRAFRLEAFDHFAATPMPDTRPEEWRYTPIRQMLDLAEIGPAVERHAVTSIRELPEGLRSVVEAAGPTGASLIQSGGSVVHHELPAEMAANGVIFSSLEDAVRDHPELVQKHLGEYLKAEEGKFAAQNSAFWTGGTFLYVPANVRVEVPIRSFRWVDESGSSVFGRTLVIAEAFSEVAVVEELASPDLQARTLSNSAAEIVTAEGAQVTYVSVQRFGGGVVHLATDRLVAGRDSRITTVYVALGSEVTRADVQCRLRAPGAHVDMFGLYVADGTQHFDHQTLQDHVAPHASSNLLFKGAVVDRGRSVFRGLIRVHPNAQRTDAYQTNRNLILSPGARADSLPNLEIAADDVRCSHAATVGQLDKEEIFYLQSRGISYENAIRLVIFGFFGEVLEQLQLPEVRKELVAAIEAKLLSM